jgi:hypothetical protein
MLVADVRNPVWACGSSISLPMMRGREMGSADAGSDPDLVTLAERRKGGGEDKNAT